MFGAHWAGSMYIDKTSHKLSMDVGEDKNKNLTTVFCVYYLLRILLTQPCDTLSCLEMTQGLTPAAAISMILSLM